jgi:hypothetical protein
MLSEHSRLLNEQLRADITPAEDGKVVEVVIRERHAPENGRKLAAAGIIFMHTGDTVVSYAANPNKKETAIRRPDSRGNPDPAIAALAYTAAVLPHPHTADGTARNLRFDVPADSSSKIADNLHALGVEDSDVPILPELTDENKDQPGWPVDENGHTHWNDDLPSMDAAELAWSLGGEFDPGNAPVSPAPVGVMQL